MLVPRCETHFNYLTFAVVAESVDASDLENLSDTVRKPVLEPP